MQKFISPEDAAESIIAPNAPHGVPSIDDSRLGPQAAAHTRRPIYTIGEPDHDVDPLNTLHRNTLAS